MSTDTRSLAEIMGFTSGHRVRDSDDDCTLCGAAPERWRVEHCPNGAEKPTVDDLLAWLRSELMPMEIEVYPDGILPRDGWDVWVNRIPDYEGKTERYNGCGPTLHAALEAAVRAVAGEEG